MSGAVIRVTYGTTLVGQVVEVSSTRRTKFRAELTDRTVLGVYGTPTEAEHAVLFNAGVHAGCNRSVTGTLQSVTPSALAASLSEACRMRPELRNEIVLHLAWMLAPDTTEDDSDDDKQ